MTAGQLSGFVRDATTVATAECAGDRRKSVRKVVQPLTQVARLLAQANDATSERKRRKKLAQARRAAAQSSQKVAKERGRLSAACLARLEFAVAAAGARLSCLP